MGTWGSGELSLSLEPSLGTHALGYAFCCSWDREDATRKGNLSNPWASLPIAAAILPGGQLTRKKGVEVTSQDPWGQGTKGTWRHSQRAAVSLSSLRLLKSLLQKKGEMNSMRVL